MPAGYDVADRKRALRARMRAVTRALAAEPDRRRNRAERLAADLATLVEGHLQASAPGSNEAGNADGRPRVMLFESLPTEIDLAPFRRWCRERPVDVFVPAVVADRIVAVAADDDAGDESTGADDGRGRLSGVVESASLDVIVVPGLAFGGDGRRLGRGGGHYDRFLVGLPPSCLRIGVAYREQRADDLPVECRDVPVDRVVFA